MPQRRTAVPSFAELGANRWEWITAFPKKYYPDHFDEAVQLYRPFIDRFAQLANLTADSADFLRRIMAEPDPPRVQLLRIFNRYVSPVTPVEMLKVKSNTEVAVRVFGEHFRDIATVRRNIARAEYYDALTALLFEHKDRGQFGYELTERFFAWFEQTFPRPEFEALGPRRAGRGIELRDVIDGYEEDCPLDILIVHDGEPVVVGFARYDSDRGGAQEDDRIGGNRLKIPDIIRRKNRAGVSLKVFFLNDGPGLGLGSMWRDYARFEQVNPRRVLVATLKMLPARLTREWMLSSS